MKKIFYKALVYLSPFVISGIYIFVKFKWKISSAIYDVTDYIILGLCIILPLTEIRFIKRFLFKVIFFIFLILIYLILLFHWYFLIVFLMTGDAL